MASIVDLAIPKPSLCFVRPSMRPGTGWFGREASAPVPPMPVLCARSLKRRIIEMAQRCNRDQKELADGAVRFLAANYRYERKCQQGLSGTAVASAALPETTSVDREKDRYQTDFLSQEEESFLLQNVKGLPFKEFVFQGFKGKRRVVSFGWRYDFNGGGLTKTDNMPGFLASTRVKAERFAGLFAGKLQQVLVTEYTEDAAIGGHKDRAVFGDVVGISLLSRCTFRFRKKAGAEVGASQLYSGAAFYLPSARARPQ